MALKLGFRFGYHRKGDITLNWILMFFVKRD